MYRTRVAGTNEPVNPSWVVIETGSRSRQSSTREKHSRSAGNTRVGGTDAMHCGQNGTTPPGLVSVAR